MLIGTRDDDDVALAGSPHARVRARWIHARTHSQGTHARTHALGLCMHARTGPVHAARTGPMHACTHRARAHCLHWVPTPARSQGPCSRARTGSPRPLHLHARTHRVRVPMPTRSQGPCTHARTGSPCPLARGRARTRRARHARSHACTGPMRACSLRVPTPEGSPCMHALGLCTLDCGVPMHVCRIPALVHAASHVVCSSSYM